MELAEVLDRAHSALAKGTSYQLGAGAPFSHPVPADERGACDCSGFVAWVFGYARHQPTFAWLVKTNGGWMSTDGIFEDAMFQPTGLWRPNDPKPGSCLVYPSRSYALAREIDGAPGPRIGHVGIITKVVGGGAKTVIHCSAGNYRRYGDAIHETADEVFAGVAYTRAVRFAGLE